MGRISEEYRYETRPQARKEAMVCGDKYRFTVLTPRLIRIEYNENGKFEDRATQSVICRDFEVPEFTQKEENGILTITTDNIELCYCLGTPFTSNSLTVRYTGKNAAVKAGQKSSEWHFGDECVLNMGGTARTLDGVDGACELESGVMSQGRIAVHDDSKSLIIAEDGWIDTRSDVGVDQYLFCYGMADGSKYDYMGCLKEFYKLTGSVPLIPRYTLGNWWSRYHAYTQDEYEGLMKRFKKEDIPFSVAVIDMDWHNVKIDTKYGSGWTGYTWNEELFPNHEAFLDFLHAENLKTSLNLHPQEGVGAHEKQYKKMAEAMGIDPSSEKSVAFDIADPHFLEEYFKILHHPLEDEGVDFWWMDWQQGNTSKVPGLDPLWMLNHYHYIDNSRSGKRGLMFSRYAGIGSHRYPIGFSGDTVITWESLKFQPYFTATASNVGYGWWSHDIGGHMWGYRCDELTMRWVQLGVFSPINRLHSCNSPFMGKEPWKYNKICELSMKRFLKLRHELIPYLYTMNYRAAKYGEPLVMPLYYRWNGAAAFSHKTQYSFGTEMMVSPIVAPHDSATTMGSAEVYFPEGVWYDFFTNRRYRGDRTLTVYRAADEMPVFVKEGGIVPMAKLTHVNDTENPKNMRVKVFMGKNGSFDLYEDDGESLNFENGAYAVTKMSIFAGEKPEFVISKPEGDLSVIPAKRNYEVELIGVGAAEEITVLAGGEKCDADICLENGVLRVLANDVCGELKITVNKGFALAKNNVENWAFNALEKFEMSFVKKDEIYGIINSKKSTFDKVVAITETNDVCDNVKRAVIEMLTADE